MEVTSSVAGAGAPAAAADDDEDVDEVDDIVSSALSSFPFLSKLAPICHTTL